MIKYFKLLICSILLFSCEGKESFDLLTNGTWMLNNGFNSSISESIRFEPNKTYTVESRIYNGRFNSPISIVISGDWSRQDKYIIFTNPIINLPNGTDSTDVIPTIPGIPIGTIYGNPAWGINANDSLLIENFSSNQAKWQIIKLTADSLIVNSDGKTVKYHND